MSTGFGAGNRAYDPWSEGLQFDQLKIYEGGVVDQKMLAAHPRQHPLPGHRDGRPALAARGLPARRAALRGADRPLRPERGRSRRSRRIYAETEQKCRAAVAKIPDGMYEAESYIDWPGATAACDIRVKVIVSGSDMTIDLSGCSPERESRINARTLAGALHRLQGAHHAARAVNEGAFSALEVIIPEGNIMMARYPAFMAGWSIAAADGRRHDPARARASDARTAFRRRTAGRSARRCRSSGRDRRRDRDFVLHEHRGRRLGRAPRRRRRGRFDVGVPGRRAQRADRDHGAEGPRRRRRARAAPGLGRRRRVPRRARCAHADQNSGGRPRERGGRRRRPPDVLRPGVCSAAAAASPRPRS